MPVVIGRKLVLIGLRQTIADEPAIPAEEMHVAAVQGQAVVDGDVAGKNFESDPLAIHGFALGRRQQTTDIFLQFSSKDPKAAHRAPRVTGIDHVETTETMEGGSRKPV